MARRGPDFFLRLRRHQNRSTTMIPRARMEHIADSDLWYAGARIEAVGKLHSFQYLMNGKQFGGSLNLPAYGPLSYPVPGVPTGTLSSKTTYTSKIYDGMKSDYWIYVPAQYDPKTPAALMIFQQGKCIRPRR